MKKKVKNNYHDKSNCKHIPRHYIPGYSLIPRDDHFEVRKIGLTGDRVKTDPNFHQTRLLGQEFGQASKLACMIYELLCWPLGIRGRHSKLQGMLMKAMQWDEERTYGSRQVQPDALFELVGYDFNENEPLPSVCSLEFTRGHVCDDSVYELQFPSFVPEYYITPAEGARRARICLLALNVNLKNFDCTVETAKTNLFPISKVHVPATALSVRLEAHPDCVQVIALGIQWYGDGHIGKAFTPSAIPGSLRVVDINFLSNDSFL